MKVRYNVSPPECTHAQELLSSYIDSMTSSDETLRLEAHLAQCTTCPDHLQSLISLRNMLAQIEPAAPPEDLVLETRVKLSHARNHNYLDWFDDRLQNVLKPLAMPALFGVSLTMLFFGVLFGNIVSTSTVLAQDFAHQLPAAEAESNSHPQWNNSSVVELASNNNRLEEPLMLGLDISEDGRVMDYNILSGRRSPAVDRWIKEVLSLARFTPATAFGKPVVSTIILTSIDVRG
jgi:putative zinc finger protein